jgi:hypothetical protein
MRLESCAFACAAWAQVLKLRALAAQLRPDVECTIKLHEMGAPSSDEEEEEDDDDESDDSLRAEAYALGLEADVIDV